MTKRNSKKINQSSPSDIGMEMRDMESENVNPGCIYSVEVMLKEFGPFRLSYSQDAGFLWRGLYAPTLAERDRAILALAAEGKAKLSLSNENVVVSWSDPSAR